GMCGPIVVSISLNLKPRGVWTPNLLYHAGRVTTYAILGGIMGATGAFARVTAGIAGLQKGVMILTGFMIVAMGLGMSGWIPLGRLFVDHYNPGGVITRGFQKLTHAKSIVAYFPMGLLLGLLPCGPVYTALIAAARTGMETHNAFKGVLSGMGLMIAFGAGTIPALLVVARLAGMDWLRSRAVIYKAGSMLMIVVGIYFVIKGIRY
ncbi:sulfite exporter TauE/SafE family protein, partial [Thermodesulfobacteriota bacterium]